ncbi:HAMP domain-containing sensor histidine kinase [Streptosporangium lutulentum]|uniref:histidine kinase n=1 Tax=Streptosporangium lutulentum TaxID=1461250 RepID=A0ABT9QMS0_9ACTN|nr:HAMP domain-containing sensor histidine kinase [Streptosporangium lutulentum]MDP9848063.1 signal transduction histidine kinase [Streptosporangium lutulentum]
MIFALVLGTGAVATSLGVRAKLRTDINNSVVEAARKAALSADKGHVPGGVIMPSNYVSRLQVVGEDGRVLAASPALKGKPAISRARPVGGDLRVDKMSCVAFSQKDRTCFLTVGLWHSKSSYGDVMVYAQAAAPPLLGGHTLEISLAVLFTVLLGLLGWGTWRMVGRTLEPVQRISAEMAEITASDLSRRMSVPDTGDEVAQLAQTLNGTLGRLEWAMENQRRFASDASHELRTPLTGLRTKLELALADPEVEDPVQAMRSALGDAERLQATMDDLLLLARLDAGVRNASQPIDLSELVVSEIGQPCRHEVILNLDPDVTVAGNRLQLCRLLANLLTNAQRHALSTVWVEVKREGGEAVLEVRDNGLGIPPDERERVFQRFTRLDSARSRDAGGTGLGLPIARDIASAHHGKLYAADSTNGRGARLILRLPLSTPLSV